MAAAYAIGPCPNCGITLSSKDIVYGCTDRVQCPGCDAKWTLQEIRDARQTTKVTECQRRAVDALEERRQKEKASTQERRAAEERDRLDLLYAERRRTVNRPVSISHHARRTPRRSAHIRHRWCRRRHPGSRRAGHSPGSPCPCGRPTGPLPATLLHGRCP